MYSTSAGGIEINCRAYPSDVTDEEWGCLLPYLLLVREEAGTRVATRVARATLVPAEVVVASPKLRRTRPPRIAFIVRPAPEQASNVTLLLSLPEAFAEQDS